MDKLKPSSKAFSTSVNATQEKKRPLFEVKKGVRGPKAPTLEQCCIR